MRKKQLEIFLSNLKEMEDPDMFEEQYTTPGDIAAEIALFAYHRGDIEGKTVIDLGSGTGRLGIASLLLGSKKTYFVEKDKRAVEILKDNLKTLTLKTNQILGEYEITEGDALLVLLRGDTIIQNPPFGTKKRKMDTKFLKKAFEIGNVVYSLHKKGNYDFIRNFALENGFELVEMEDLNFPIKAMFEVHKKRKVIIEVELYRFMRCYNGSERRD
ncbi:MAG: RsmD family RNA methyltransferase [Candidatus Methanofastidiosum sp.]|nr:RsmD family RNA methyltransferase [Methanofastidiosum sp.]HOC77084.1 METTL5 family protein [Methanofastidiosum sp.]HOG73349.1 METTL5 family protein [Methanofastidiosum sp.]HPA48622.1 METTL5 family protein [Methanofastidiosum sp.]HQK62181.1 METTL5 family protein [Methanofastidiosum sp.]